MVNLKNDMLMEWLEPKIQERVKSIIEQAEEGSNVYKGNHQYYIIFNEMDLSIEEKERKLLHDLEAAVGRMKESYFEAGYKLGLEDGIELIKSI